MITVLFGLFAFAAPSPMERAAQQCESNPAPCEQIQSLLISPTRANTFRIITDTTDVDVQALLLATWNETDPDRAEALADLAGRMLIETEGEHLDQWLQAVATHPQTRVRAILVHHSRKAPFGGPVAALGTEDAVPEVRATAARALASHKEQAVAALIPLLSDSDLSVRTAALKAMGTTRLPEFTPVIEKAVAEPALRKTALRELSRLDLVRAQTLAKPFLTDADKAVALEAKRITEINNK